MALIKCPVCGCETSDRISKCRNCGNPTIEKLSIEQEVKKEKIIRNDKKYLSTKLILISVIIILLFCIIVVFYFFPEKNIFKQIFSPSSISLENRGKKSLESVDYYQATTSLNVRSGPGMDNSVLFSLTVGNEVKLVDRKNDWFEIKFKDKNGFVFSKYLRFSRTVTETKNENTITKTDNSIIIAITILIAVVIIIIFFPNRKKKQIQRTDFSLSSVPHQPMQQRVIVTKSTKSVGTAVFLVVIFGPFGMFYSTIGGAILMSIAAPIIMVMLLMSGKISSIIIAAIFYYPICMIWAANAASSYNQRIIREANK